MDTQSYALDPSSASTSHTALTTLQSRVVPNHGREYESEYMATGLTFVFVTFLYFFLGFVLTFKGYLMGRNHRLGFSFLICLPYFTALYGYLFDRYPQFSVPESPEALPHHTWIYIYAVVASFVAVVCLHLCRMVALYLAGFLLGVVVAETTLVLGFPDADGGYFMAVLALTYAISIVVCMFAMKKLLWSAYLATIVACGVGGFLIAWGVNFLTILHGPKFWIEMPVYRFLDGLSQQTYEEYSKKEHMNIFFSVWGVSAIGGFLWQLGDVDKHKHDDDGEHFLASDYEKVRTGH